MCGVLCCDFQIDCMMFVDVYQLVFGDYGFCVYFGNDLEFDCICFVENGQSFNFDIVSVVSQLMLCGCGVLEYWVYLLCVCWICDVNDSYFVVMIYLQGLLVVSQLSDIYDVIWGVLFVVYGGVVYLSVEGYVVMVDVVLLVVSVVLGFDVVLFGVICGLFVLLFGGGQ